MSFISSFFYCMTDTTTLAKEEQKIPPQSSSVETKEPQQQKEEVKSEEKKETKEQVLEQKEKEENIENLIPIEPYRLSPLFYEIAHYFGIEERDYDGAKDALSLITEWAIHETKTNRSEELLLKIRELEDAIRKPEWGERRYANVYRYLRLELQQQALNKAKAAYKR